MKTTIFSLLLSVGLLCSCSDFLEEDVYSFASGKTLFDTPENAEMALTGVYDAMNANSIQGKAPYALFARNMFVLSQVGCDEMIGRTDFIPLADFKPFCNHTYNSESRFLADAWFALYAGIYRANNVIEKLPSVVMDETRKQEMILEARFLRGFYYTYLAWLWGGVPTPLSTTADAKLPRSSVRDVYTIIINDLKAAYHGLSARNIYDSRANKYTAAAMLAKVDLYLAACKENNVGSSLNFSLNSFDWVDSQTYYEEAKTLCADICTNGGYILLSKYGYNFIADNVQLKKEQIKEALMVATFGKEGSKYFFYTHLTGPAGNVNTNGGGAGWFPAMGELASLYNMSDVRFKQNIGGAYYTAKTTIEGVEYYVPVNLYGSGSNTFLTKFRQSSPASRSASGIPTYLSTLNIPLIRLADVWLMYAEATYKTGDETKARKLLEPVRLRAAMGNATLARDLATAYHKADFMEELKDERSRELCAEGVRRFDLIRWGKLESVVKNLQSDPVTGLTPNIFYYNERLAKSVKDNFLPFKIWYPIPKREMEVNTNLVQNPGWEQLAK